MITNTLGRPVVLSSQPTNHHPQRSHVSHRITILVFLVMIGVPAIGSILRKARLPQNENRALHPAPPFPSKRWQFQSFPFVFDAYFADRIGFRKELLTVRRQILLDGLGDSTAENVFLGRYGWMFINSVGPSGLPVIQADPIERVQAWSEVLRERRDWLKERGIKYLVIVVPEKSSVYPEHLPDWMRRHPPPNLTALLKQSVEIVDPLPAIREAKATTPDLYFRKDSHWTDAGAYHAYRTLGSVLEREIPNFQMKPFSRFLPIPLVTNRCDLAWSLGYPEDQCRETSPYYSVPHDPIAVLPNEQLKKLTAVHKDRLKHIEELVIECASGHGSAVLLHDSFGGNLVRMLACDFRRMISTGTYGLPINVIEREKPDIVIQLMVERTLTMVRPTRLSD